MERTSLLRLFSTGNLFHVKVVDLLFIRSRCPANPNPKLVIAPPPRPRGRSTSRNPASRRFVLPSKPSPHPIISSSLDNLVPNEPPQAAPTISKPSPEPFIPNFNLPTEASSSSSQSLQLELSTSSKIFTSNKFPPLPESDSSSHDHLLFPLLDGDPPLGVSLPQQTDQPPTNSGSPPHNKTTTINTSPIQPKKSKAKTAKKAKSHLPKS